MRLRDLFFSVVIAVCLIVTPVMVGTSLFKAGYNFEPLLQPEYKLEWSKEKQSEYLLQMAPGLNIAVTLSTYDALQIHEHYDIAAEVPLYWSWKSTNPVYLVNECPRKKPAQHWHVARLLGPFMKGIPGIDGQKLHSAKMGMLIAEIDYQNTMLGLPGPYMIEPELVKPVPLREASL